MTDARGASTVVVADEHPRPDTTIDSLRKLAPVFGDVEGHAGIITAGTSSGITDGAAAVVLMSERRRACGRYPATCAHYRMGIGGVDPRIMGIGPVPAMRKLFARLGLTLDDFDLVELNEAFAPQVLAVLRDVPIPAEKLNVNGGAIALGHPIGCTGARILVTLLHEMEAPRRAARPRDALRQRRNGDGDGDRKIEGRRKKEEAEERLGVPASAGRGQGGRPATARSRHSAHGISARSAEGPKRTNKCIPSVARYPYFEYRNHPRRWNRQRSHRRSGESSQRRRRALRLPLRSRASAVER